MQPIESEFQHSSITAHYGRIPNIMTFEVATRQVGRRTLGLLAICPSVSIGFLFASRCVVASCLFEDLGAVEPGSWAIWYPVAGWLAISPTVVLDPLLVFARALL